MNKKYLLESSLKVARFSRLLAKAIDIFIVLVVSIFFYPLGILISIAYMTLADAIQNGQSVGKKFIGFQVISLEDGSLRPGKVQGRKVERARAASTGASP